MQRMTNTRAFSLIEVVISVGIFAIAVTTILALLPSLARQTSASADLLTAQRLPEALRVELQRLATRDGFGALATAVPIVDVSSNNGFGFVAAREGLRVATLAESDGVMVDDEQYFFLEVWRFAGEPLAYASNAAVLPVLVRVSWPYRVPGSLDATSFSARAQFSFTAAINR